MKLIFKNNASKIGFTLLEVVLSIAIMLTMTTMMMNGFAATMSYSYHTSVFATTAASNYGKVVSSVATRSTEGRGAYRNLPSDPNQAGEVKIKFSQVIAGVSGNSFYARVLKADSGVTAAQQQVGYRSQSENWGGADGTYANNMTSFYFRPTIIGNGEEANDPTSDSYGRCFLYQRWNGTSWVYEWRDESEIDPSNTANGGWMSLGSDAGHSTEASESSDE